ncbi:DUF3795 domain-containing protein [Neglectibacter caecimuris]|jgi:hypothetical protein|uniref:DUF3795 domain-containing protein n=1 Tax=Neglectibacter caecimuris TaxID=3093658 RepID=UPI002AC9B97C|nr:DUF3795 domain-containing protein [Neglectibacter sp. M00184]
MKTICGLDCNDCPGKETCPGCEEVGGQGKCVIYACASSHTGNDCESCHYFDGACHRKERLIQEFNDLGIKDMPRVTDLTALPGHYINLEYTLPGGQKAKLWDDKRIYLGAQLEKPNSERCYGLTADENYLLVCEYGENGSDPEIVCYRRRDK